MSGRLPTEAEINVYGSLDEASAVRNFLGKSLGEARALFAGQCSSPWEDLMWMGPRAFDYYVDAAIDVLLSHDADGNCMMALELCGCLEFRIKERGERHPKLVAPLTRIIDEIDRFDVRNGITDDVPARLAAVLKQMQA